MVIMEFDEVEVVAAVGALLGTFASAFADGEDSETRGQGEGLLGAGEKDVDAQLVFGDGQRRE